MSYSKISSIILWIVAGISLVVMIFFFVAENTKLADELEIRVTELQNGTTEDQTAMTADVDSTAIDSLATDSIAGDAVAEDDSAKVAEPVQDLTTTTTAVPEEIDLKEHLTGMELLVYKRTDYALVWAYILLIIAAVAAVVFPLLNIVTDVKAIVRLLILLGGTAAMIILCYFVFASDQPLEIMGYIGTDNSNPTVLKWVGTGLFMTYILFGMALLSILYSEVVKIFK